MKAEGVLQFVKKHSSTILTVASVAGLVTTSVLTVKATVKATKLIDEEKNEKERELTKTEVIMTTGKVYLPAILVGVSTAACMIGSNILNKRQQRALSSAYILASTSFVEYKDKLKELYGEETHNNIIDSLAIEKAKDVHISGSYLVGGCDLSVEEGGEPCLFYEEYSGRYFEATIEQVLSAEYHLNRNYTLRGYSTLNELYDFLGLEETEYGDILGWAPLDEGMYWIEFNHRKVVMDDGLVCYILEMPFEPSKENLEEYL